MIRVSNKNIKIEELPAMPKSRKLSVQRFINGIRQIKIRCFTCWKSSQSTAKSTRATILPKKSIPKIISLNEYEELGRNVHYIVAGFHEAIIELTAYELVQREVPRRRAACQRPAGR